MSAIKGGKLVPMADHSDLVARLRARVEKRADGPTNFALMSEAADALDVKPGANAELIAEARSLIMGVTFWTADGRTLPQKEHLIARLTAALEAADSRARVLPTREQILDRVRQVVRDEEGEEDGDSIAFCERVTDAVLALLTGGKADE